MMLRRFFMAVITEFPHMTQKEIWYETLHTGFGQYFR